MPEPGGPDPVPQSAPPKLWSVEEANASLDRLRELLPQLKAWAVRLGKVHAELQRLSQFWGKELTAQDIPDRDLKLRLEEEWKRLTARLEGEVKRLEAEGITVKDLENGLVDFYSRRRGEVVYLCWRRGEAEVANWHPLTGGFRSRRPLEGKGRAAPTARLGHDR
ncbi:MAG: DUF2203 domain-containing protein [Thermoplasmata archaeon]|nr:DUF2203 domain-containing protein [Thermoplasmata archaeon]MCI4342242.1 DUF2203 domain-containing protein [Thermoplasmata archaeon]